jgi:UDP-glucose 4-epimerase
MILVTGGAGYIGSHAVLELLLAGQDVLVLDNLCNSSRVALQRVEKLAGRSLHFVKGDIRRQAQLDALFAQYPIEAVLHFAGLKAVGESVRHPLSYYDNNVGGSLTLCQAMADAGVFKLVFSSSATVYGTPKTTPISEQAAVGVPTNPYGQSKLMVENFLRDLAAADPRWSIALLRYFNPIGAHESGMIGEDPSGIPNNLLPYLTQVAIGRLERLNIYGSDYPTPDGTGIRDYIHVVDLAKGHLLALCKLQTIKGAHAWNLGTGRGHSVLELVRTFEEVAQMELPYRFAPRRHGDIAACWADPSKAEKELGWKAERSLTQMITDAWRWQVQNPSGYRVTETVKKSIKQVPGTSLTGSHTTRVSTPANASV